MDFTPRPSRTVGNRTCDAETLLSTFVAFPNFLATPERVNHNILKLEKIIQMQFPGLHGFVGVEIVKKPLAAAWVSLGCILRATLQKPML